MWGDEIGARKVGRKNWGEKVGREKWGRKVGEETGARIIRRLTLFLFRTGFINLRNKIHLSNCKENKNTKLNLLGLSLVNKANSKPKPNYASY